MIKNLERLNAIKKAETWQKLIAMKKVKGEMPQGEWNLQGINLRRADLINTFFAGANLMNADMAFSNCAGANFNNARLILSRLNGSNCIGTGFSRTSLAGVNFEKADLSGAFLSEADLTGAILCDATLIGAMFYRAVLNQANFTGANLSNTNFVEASLSQTNLSNTNISEVNFESSSLIKTNFSGATITDCRIFGISVWGVMLDGVKEQSNLRITPENEPEIIVDNLEVAQFVYLLLHNEKIRSIIDTIGKKGVLILGRFIPERKVVLDTIRNKLRQLGYVPMMFDFEKPNQRDFTETIKILAGMSRFIIADITNPKSSPLELQATIPDYMIPFVPIIQEGEKPFSMFEDLAKYPWMVNLLEYDSLEKLEATIDNAIVKPAIQLADELACKKSTAEKAKTCQRLPYYLIKNNWLKCFGIRINCYM